ncbi:MAG: dynamin family protein [Chloroflexota bacterium]
MSRQTNLGEQIQWLCDEVIRAGQGTPVEEDAAWIRDRMAGPLRVAIAGRVKAGKSTLLNVLVGERLAPTDAGECTKVVSWYQQGPGYDVRARLYDGSWRDLRFRRDDGELEINLEDLGIEAIERIEVSWPSSNLARMTLIDTPGLASLREETSARTRAFFTSDEEARQSDADAVLYLMRHLHRRDADFLEAFFDPSLNNASPVNAIGVLSRADEIGAGRPDALESADRIAARYRDDERVRALAVSVLPVAGLLAETGTTLQEWEAAALRDLAAMPVEESERMLLSVDRFTAPESSDLLVETRRHLLHRLGLFGVRVSLDAIRRGDIQSAVELSRFLIDLSGVNRLRTLLETHFTTRAQALKGRSALNALLACTRELEKRGTNVDSLLAEIERVEAASHEFAELRLLHLVLTGQVKLSDEERAEVSRITTDASPALRAGCDPDAGPDEVQSAVLNGIARWRQRGANPLLDRAGRDACEIIARSYEGIYAEVMKSSKV